MKVKNYLSLSFVLLISLFVFTVTANAGWVMEETDGSTTYIGQGMIKSQYHNEGLDFSHIIDTSKNMISMVEKKRKIYGTGNPDEYCKAIKAFGEEMQEQALAGLPPEQRKMMQEQMQQMAKSAPVENMSKPVVLIKKTGSNDVIAEHKTDKYTVTVDGAKYQDIWITSDISIDDEMKKLGLDKFQFMMNRLDKCMNPSEESMEMMADPFDSPEYKKLTEKGFVMKEINYTGGFSGSAGEERKEVVRLEKMLISASEFKIPTGYKKVHIKELFKGMMGGADNER